MSSAARHDTPARVTGIVVFLVGVALLGFVFVTANRLFDAPPPAVPPMPPPGAPPGAPSPALEIGKSFSQLLRQILLLLLMSVAGSVIASKGIQLFFAARNVAGEPTRSADVPVAAAAPPPPPSRNGQAATPPASTPPPPDDKKPAPGEAPKAGS
jgi:hypothetical protein